MKVLFSLQIFGKDITDVMLSHSLLLIMHQRGKISIHSLEEVLANGKLYTAKLGQFIPDHGIVGAAGVGLPINIKLKGMLISVYPITVSTLWLYRCNRILIQSWK